MSNYVPTVQKLYQLFGEGNIAALFEHFADDIVWKDSGAPFFELPSDTISGKVAVGGFFEKLGQYMDFKEFNPTVFFGEGNMVCVQGNDQYTDKRTGKSGSGSWAMVWTFGNDGKVKKFEGYGDTYQIAKTSGKI